MAVLLGIGKGIGILLLIVIGLILLVAVTVLCVPVRWHVLVAKEDAWSGRGKITWLLHLISLTWKYDQGKPQMTFRICGWRIKKRSASQKKKKKRSQKSRKSTGGRKKKSTGTTEGQINQNDGKRPEGSKPTDRTEVSSRGQVTKAGQTVRTEPDSEKLQQAEAKPGPVQTVDQKQTESAGKRLSFGQRFCKIKKKLYAFWQMIRTLPQKIRDMVRSIRSGQKKYWNDTTRAFLRMSIETLRDLWRHSHAQKLKGTVRFGTSDPCTTGEILGVIAIFYPVLGNKVQIQPEFDETVLQGQLEWKGHLRLFYALKAVLHVFLSPEWRDLQRGFEENKGE